MGNFFSKEIAGKQFNFQPFEFGDQTGYHIDVKDEQGRRWEFRALFKNEKWAIEGEDIPGWIYDVQNLLGKAIDDHG
jgi:hypothetical protein